MRVKQGYDTNIRHREELLTCIQDLVKCLERWVEEPAKKGHDDYDSLLGVVLEVNRFQDRYSTIIRQRPHARSIEYSKNRQFVRFDDFEDDFRLCLEGKGIVHSASALKIR